MTHNLQNSTNLTLITFKNELKELSKKDGIWNGYLVIKNDSIQRINVFEYILEKVFKKSENFTEQDLEEKVFYYLENHKSDIEIEDVPLVIKLAKNVGLTQKSNTKDSKREQLEKLFSDVYKGLDEKNFPSPSRKDSFDPNPSALPDSSESMSTFSVISDIDPPDSLVEIPLTEHLEEIPVASSVPNSQVLNTSRDSRGLANADSRERSMWSRVVNTAKIAIPIITMVGLAVIFGSKADQSTAEDQPPDDSVGPNLDKNNSIFEASKKVTNNFFNSTSPENNRTPLENSWVPQKENEITSPPEDFFQEKFDSTANFKKLTSPFSDRNSDLFARPMSPFSAEIEDPNRVSPSLLKLADSYIDNPKTCPKAHAGRDACLPEGAPIVIKKFRDEELISKMDQARKLCRESSYTRLTIAKASLYRGHVVQNLLPVLPSNKLNIGLYLENLASFSGAIKEFTGLLCQAKFEDIDSSQAFHPYRNLSKLRDVPRFDQVGLYLEKSDNGMQGKIALIDLDCFSIKNQGDDLSHQIETAVLFFPHHYEEILTEAEKFYPNIRQKSNKLEMIRDDTIEYFQKIYTNHLQILRDNNVSISNPRFFAEAPPDEVKALIHQKVFDNFIKHLNENKETVSAEQLEHFMSAEQLEHFKRDIIPEWFDLIYQRIGDDLNEKPLTSIETNAELVDFRNLKFFHLPRQLHQDSKWKSEPYYFPLRNLVDSIFQQMVDHKMIATFFKTTDNNIEIFL